MRKVEDLIPLLLGLSGSGTSPVAPTTLGYIDENTGTLPTTRSDGSALVRGDNFKVSATATLPFDITDGFTGDVYTIENVKDTIGYDGVKWQPNLNPFQNTYETPLTDKTKESLAGTSTRQSEANEEFVNRLKELKAVVGVTELPTTNIDYNSIYHLTTDTASQVEGYYYNNETEWVPIITKDECIVIEVEEVLPTTNIDITKIYHLTNSTDTSVLDGYYWYNTSWHRFNEYTKYLNISDPTTESLDGTKTTQAEVNAEVIERLKDLKAVIEVNELPTADIDVNAIYSLLVDTPEYDKGNYYYNEDEEWILLSQEIELENAYSRLVDIEDYLFEAYYDKVDYDFANKYFENIPVLGHCSTMAWNNLFLKSHDWKYDEYANFVVHTTNKDGRYATLGVSASVNDLTNDFVKTRKYNVNYKAVPLCMADGMNEKGLCVSIATVPQDKGNNFLVEAQVVEQRKMHYLLVPRYILDFYDNAQEAVEYLRDYVTFYMNSTGTVDVHYLVSDANKSFVVEFDNGTCVIKELTKPIMTNFHLIGTTLNDDGTVYTPETKDATHSATTTNNITPHGQGLERFNLLNHYYDIGSVGVSTLVAIEYIRMYDTSPRPSDPYWYTELTDNTHTVDTDITDYADVKAAAGSAFTSRTRDGKTWTSTHQCIYNNKTLQATVCGQSISLHRFSIPKPTPMTSENIDLADGTTESLDGTATKQNEANTQFVEKIKEIEPLVLVVTENQTINGYSVPKLTEEDITKVYNAQIAGKQVIIKDATENYSFAPKQVDTDTDDVYVCFDFCDVMVLTYNTTTSGVETKFKEYEGTKHIDITQAEFDVLTPEEKNNGTVYFITDGGGVPTKQMILDVDRPVGSHFKQYGETDNPNALFNGPGLKSVWEEVEADGYEQINSSVDAGTIVNEELPNIKGQFFGRQFKGDATSTFGVTCDSSEGAFTSGDTVNNVNFPSNGNSYSSPSAYKKVKLDASITPDSVYKDGGKVQPRGFTAKLWKRVE